MEKKLKFRTLKSPYDLIQEDYHGDPWRITIIWILVRNQFKNVTYPVIRKVFETYPTVESLATADVKELTEIVKPAGRYNDKTESLLLLSRRIFSGDWEGPEDLPGIGPKGLENYRIFVNGELIDTEQKTLKKYVEWARSIEQEEK